MLTSRSSNARIESTDSLSTRIPSRRNQFQFYVSIFAFTKRGSSTNCKLYPGLKRSCLVNHTQAQNISTMKQETEPIWSPSKKQKVTNMNDALAQMRSSGSIHFLKSLPQSAIQKGRGNQKYTELTLPTQFIQENCDKIEEWVILRAQSSNGKSSRPWLVRLRVDKSTSICIALGWRSFVIGNRLKKGDSLIFLLKEDARSEFEVHMFRGPQGSPHFPDKRDNSSADNEEEIYFSASEEENSKQSQVLSPGHDHAEAFPHTKHLEEHRTYPGFRKRLTASNIKGSSGDSNSAQFAFPRSFMRTHGNQVHNSVQLQGIHEESPTYFVTCRQSPQHRLMVYFLPKEWSRFVKENGLESGQELQFSLTGESYFVVRKV